MEKVQVKSLDELYHRYCEGHRPTSPVFNGKFQESNRFPKKGRRYAISSSNNGKSGVLRDHVLDKSINWYLAGHTFKKTSKKTKPQEKEIKDVSSEFKKFAIAQSHPYTTAKGVSIANLNFRQDKGNLLIPFYTLQGFFMSGWQKIWSETDSEGKWPKTTRKGSSNKNVYLPIGETKEGESINVGEGPSTCLSLLKINKRQTYICFGKNNLEAIAWYLLGKNKQVNLYLDFDKENQFIPTIKHKNLRIFRPDKQGDFNDFQDVESEIQKIKNCYPTWEVPEMELPKDAKELKKQFDDFGYEVRLNTRKDVIEVKGFKDSKTWCELIDEEHSLLYLKAKSTGKLTKTDYVERLKAVASVKKVDPFKEYLKKLVWDEKERLTTFLPSIFKISDQYLKLAEWSLKGIMLACVQRAFHPGYKFDEFVIFSGGQGLGKSSFLYHLFEDKSLYSNSINFSDKTQNIVEATLGKVIIEVAELAGFGQANIERMKNIITSQQDRVRLSYRKNARDYLRQSVFVGTTNNTRPLPNDATGMRRFIPIELEEKMEFSKMIKEVEKCRDQLWAEAMTLYQKGESARLPKELWDISAEVAERKRGANQAFEEVFLKEVIEKENNTQEGEDVVIYTPGILKFLKDGKEVTDSDGKRYKIGGGWIRDISPTSQSRCADLLKGRGYKEGRKRENGQNLRVHIKKADKNKANIPQNTPINEVKTEKAKPATLSASEEFGPLGYNKIKGTKKGVKSPKNEEDIGQPPF